MYCAQESGSPTKPSLREVTSNKRVMATSPHVESSGPDAETGETTPPNHITQLLAQLQNHNLQKEIQQELRKLERTKNFHLESQKFSTDITTLQKSIPSVSVQSLKQYFKLQHAYNRNEENSNVIDEYRVGASYLSNFYTSIDTNDIKEDVWAQMSTEIIEWSKWNAGATILDLKLEDHRNHMKKTIEKVAIQGMVPHIKEDLRHVKSVVENNNINFFFKLYDKIYITKNGKN